MQPGLSGCQNAVPGPAASALPGTSVFLQHEHGHHLILEAWGGSQMLLVLLAGVPLEAQGSTSPFSPVLYRERRMGGVDKECVQAWGRKLWRVGQGLLYQCFSFFFT